MDLELTGKTAIVTGGSAGIGLACAKALYREGVNTAIAARDENRLEQAVQEIRSASSNPGQAEVIAISADLTRAEDIQRIVQTVYKRFGRVDILINNAGSARAGAFSDLEDEDFLAAWNLKLLGYIRMIRALLPYMTEQEDGRIVNIIGGAAHTPSPTFLPGSTTNAALLNFTKGISRELIRYKIRINAILPGPTATERAKRLNKQTAEAKGISEHEAWQESAGNIPLGRMVEPDEIAAMTLFFVSDLATSIVGAEVTIDGGYSPCI
ncbi:MAG TPA: SDR family oxidoreductase [bacterium]|nr:SDR family oxidoreductase [bacterium]